MTVIRSFQERGREAQPEIDQEKRCSTRDGIRQRLHELLAGRIDPVQILDEDDGRRIAGARTDEDAQDFEQLDFQRTRIELGRRVLGVSQPQKFEQQEQLLLGRCDRSKAVDHTAPRHLQGVVDPNSEDVAQQL